MSIREMIREHPDMGSEDSEALGSAVKHAMYCAAICNSCADACSAEQMDMRQCIRLCMDCSDMCAATYRVASRRTGQNATVLAATLEACITACDVCAAECEQHDNAHCQRCARMCRECAQDCRNALATLQRAG